MQEQGCKNMPTKSGNAAEAKRREMRENATVWFQPLRQPSLITRTLQIATQLGLLNIRGASIGTMTERRSQNSRIFQDSGTVV